MRVVFASRKGGCGKSSLAIAVAWELHARGARVLLVDADEQGTAREVAAIATEQGKPSPTCVAMGAGMHRPDQLPQLAEAFEHVIIDSPGAAAAVVRSALMLADLAVVPVGASPADLWGARDTLDLIEAAQEIRPELRAALVLTRIQGRTALGRGARAVAEQAGLPVLEAETTYRVAWPESLAAGCGVSVYAPRDRAAEEVRALVAELLAAVSRPAHQRTSTARQPDRSAHA